MAIGGAIGAITGVLSNPNVLTALKLAFSLGNTVKEILSTVINLKPGEDLTDEQLKVLADQTDAAYRAAFGKDPTPTP